MINKIERDNSVIRMKALGIPSSTIAELLGVSNVVVTRVLHRNAHNITAERPPAGMSVKTACLIRRAFGVWPSSETTTELAGRLADFQKSPGAKRTHWDQFAEWLARYEL